MEENKINKKRGKKIPCIRYANHIVCIPAPAKRRVDGATIRRILTRACAHKLKLQQLDSQRYFARRPLSAVGSAPVQRAPLLSMQSRIPCTAASLYTLLRLAVAVASSLSTKSRPSVAAAPSRNAVARAGLLHMMSI
uniref:Uncharacterized protein n=1 Tax=Setaria viridis TaxID=4556 RepID=A0A4U6TC63_SETVI|nr:hypothetical protein SEVIR_8G012500v2 [Setaria viridis]